VVTPVAAQLFIDRSAQDGVAVLASLSVTDNQSVGGSLNVVEVKVGAFTNPQAAGVDQQQGNAVALERNRLEDPGDFLGGEDGGKAFAVAGLDLVKTFHFEFQHAPIEVLGRREGLAQGPRSPVKVPSEVNEVAAKLLLADLLGIFAEVFCDKAQAAVIGTGGAVPEILQFEVFGKAKH